MDTLVGTVLGGYTLMRLLGSGGMGTVYLAEDRTIGQQVAIKVIRTDDSEYVDSSSRDQAAQRFKQEARAVAGLDHLHILPLFRYGEEETPGGRRAYMVMQYRPEGSLWDWLRRRIGQARGEASMTMSRLPSGLPTIWPVGVEEAADYLQQAASALQYAHDRGILHRDVKPANFLLRFDTSSTGKSAFLLLSDFGLAKFFSSISSSSHVLGTPTYMAPEQFEGVPGPETDQYALAVMIYGLLAGRPPFEGDPMRLMHQHLVSNPAPIRAYVPTLSTGIESVLMRALAKKPHQRYPSIMVFAEAFAQNMYKEASRNFSSTKQVPAIRHLNPSGNASAPAVQGQRLTSQQPIVQMPSAFAPTVYTPVETPRNAPTQGSSVPSSSLQSQGFSTPMAYSPAPQQGIPSSSVQPQGLSAPMAYSPALPQGMASSANERLVSSLTHLSAGQMEQPSEPDEQRISRRSALGWIIAGAATVGVGTGAGIYFYLRREPAQIKAILRGHSAGVTSVAWSPDSSQLVSGARDRTARLWSGSNFANTLIYPGHQAALLTTAWRPDGTSIASGGRDNMIQVWTTTGITTNRFPAWVQQ